MLAKTKVKKAIHQRGDYMNIEVANELLEELKEGKLSELTIKKEDFLSFREQLIKREDFKHYRGTAKHNGHTSYTYLSKARS